MKMLMKDLFGVVLLAGFGGFVRTLTGKKHGEPYNLKIGVTEVLIAIFAGLLMHWICREYVVSDNLRTAAIALAGYSARGIMSILDIALIQRCRALARFFHRLPLLPVIITLSAIAVGISLSGCQELTHREYYEPSDVNMVEIGGRRYGPVKVETVKSGVPDWSEGKSFHVSAVK